MRTEVAISETKGHVDHVTSNGMTETLATRSRSKETLATNTQSKETLATLTQGGIKGEHMAEPIAPATDTKTDQKPEPVSDATVSDISPGTAVSTETI